MNPLVLLGLGYLLGRMISPGQIRKSVEQAAEEAQMGYVTARQQLGYVTAQLGQPQPQVKFRGGPQAQVKFRDAYGPGAKAKDLMNWFPG